MAAADPRLVSALTEQLARRQVTLAGGARHVGWKLGMGDAERIGQGPVVGHLTSATQLEPDAAFVTSDDAWLHADVELTAVIGRDIGAGGDVAAAIGGWAVALELVDLGQGGDDPEAIVAANVFHRAFALGPTLPSADLPPEGLTGSLSVNGKILASAAVADVEGRLAAAARILSAVGESLRAGDRVITGSIVQEPVRLGDALVADLGPLRSVALRVRAPG
jgi:2-keto-4-pentenoate hydratase